MTDATDDTEDTEASAQDEAPQDIDAGGGSVTTQAPAGQAPDDAATTDVTLPGTATVKTVTPTPTEQISGAMGAEQEANTAEAEAIAKQASAESQAAAGAANTIAKLPTQTSLVAANQAKNDALAQQFADQKIDPNRLFHNMDTGQKIAAGIGMLLSGFGSGASGQPNLAAKVIDDAITRDIDAQKNAQGQAETLWKMNREALGNEQAANLATQNQMLSAVQFKINSAASQFKGPVALAQAQKENARIEQEKGIRNQKLALFGPATQDSPDPATRVGQLQRFGMITPEQATQSLKEIKGAQDITALTPQMDAAFERAASRNPVVSAQGQRELAAIMNTTVTEEEGTARQAAFDSIHKNIIPNGTTALPGENETKLRSMHEYVRSKAAAPFSKSIGIDLSQFPTTAIPAAPAPAPAPGSNTQGGKPMNAAAQYKAKNGRSIENRGGKWHYVPSGGS